MDAVEAPATPTRPYKFLEFYTEADAPIFFGRRRETEQLLADIITARLVILFAKTGSGKSSLINAGVRPRLRDLDYDTAFIRIAVSRDPARAIREELGLGATPELAEQLFAYVDGKRRPLVLFLDQFEEFFLFGVRGSEEDRRTSAAFIREAGRIYRKRNSGVHIVFSMREDFLAEMDVFTAEIPTIFHNDSRLRLRGFDEKQARKAIEGPTERIASPFSYEPELVTRVASELPQEDGRIAPGALQIVCDTLWRTMVRAGGTVVTHELYDELGGAKGILEGRLFSDIAKLTDSQRDALCLLIPSLRTAERTKQTRSLSELASLTGLDPTVTESLMKKLEEKRLIRSVLRDSDTYVEWVSDYLASLSEELETRIELLALARPDYDRERVIAALTNPAIVRRLSPDDWTHLLRHAGRSMDTLVLWHSRATAYGFAPWPELQALLAAPSTTIDVAERVIELATDRGATDEKERGEAVKLLGSVLERDDLGPGAVRALGTIPGELAEHELERAGKAPALVGAAADAAKARSSLEPAQQAVVPPRSEPQLPDNVPRLDPGTWQRLVEEIHNGRCIPVLGPATVPVYLPTGRDLARMWAQRFDYPFPDVDDLMRVSQFVATQYRAGHPRRLLADALSAAGAAVQGDEDVQRMLAALPFSWYVTTRYDDALDVALKRASRMPSVQAVMPSAQALETTSSEMPPPSVSEPRVLHLFGNIQNDRSLVLTLDEHLEWLSGIAANPESLPVTLKARIAEGTILFLGFGLTDISLRVVLQALKPLLRRSSGRHVNILASIETELLGATDAAVKYAETYYRAFGLSTFWGTTGDFVRELYQRWMDARGT